MFGPKKSQQRRLEGALKKLQDGDIKKAMRQLLDLAKEEHPEAEYWLADINEFTLKNLPEAAKWYSRAAAHGHAKSQWCLANIYMTGIDGTELNRKEAIRLYHAAADEGIPEAQFVLGESYRTGDAVERDTDKALLWYERSAQAGYKPAEIRIQQFWPDGVFQERRPVVEASDPHTMHKPQAALDENLSSLHQEIINFARQHNHIPQDEFPFIPELIVHQEKLVALVCGQVNKDMKTVGLDDGQMITLFTFVFRRGFDLAYQWHKSSDGKIDDTITLSNPLKEDRFLQLPDDVLHEVKSMDAPRNIYRIMNSWWRQRENDLRAGGMDIWSPLALALTDTSGVAVSIALKMFGYRK